MKIYIAAPWVRRPEAIEIGNQFIAAGHELTSRWFHHPAKDDPSGMIGEGDALIQEAREDIEDIQRSDALVVLNLEKSEGKAVETGIAIAAGLPVISVFKRSNIFQALGYEVTTIEDALAVIAAQPPKT